MSKTVKIILIVAVLGIMILICLCLLLGGVITLGTFLNTSTPTAAPMVTLPTVLPPTAVPPTAVQSTAVPATPAPTVEPATPAPLSPDAGFVLEGVNLKIFSVRYTSINGGEDWVFSMSGKDKFMFLVTLDSNEKELGFIYDNYFDTIQLVDTVSGESTLADSLTWSGEDSQTNSGYVKISFPVTKVPEKPAIYFNDEIGVDLTPLLPASIAVEDPWSDIKKKFDVYGNDLKVQSVILTSNYTALDGHKFEIEEKGNKILIVKFISSKTDLSGVEDWNPMIIDPNNPENQYGWGYWSWDSTDSQGTIEFSYEVPGDFESPVLYIPYDNLMNLTPLVKKE
ncbi:MAG: SPOR domain-containing protein [Anaerolineaceae bacterium]